MNYIECKWHLASEKPVWNAEYIVMDRSKRIHYGFFEGGSWENNDIMYWSDVPYPRTDEELDLEELRKYIVHSSAEERAFLAGCKSARERMKK